MQKTIKEMRNIDILRLAQRKNENPTPEEMEAARQTMKYFYLFAAAYNRSFYTNQDRNATPEERKKADAKSEKAYKRAAENLKKYSLKISCPGLYPIIEELNGCNFTYGHYYG